MAYEDAGRTDDAVKSTVTAATHASKTDNIALQMDIFCAQVLWDN